jgi:hypothetical protein
MNKRNLFMLVVTLLLGAVVGLRVAGAQQTSVPTIKVTARETVVDITVTDAMVSPVHGLIQTDFTLLEDGKEMQPNSFEEHRSARPRPMRLRW